MQPSPFYINRRNFLKGTSAALALAAMQAYGMNVAPSSRTWRVALIGTGWYGKSDLFRLMQVASVNVVALCDPDRHMLEEASKMIGQRTKGAAKPKLYSDYRILLSENEVDVVLIGTPDHWHALSAIAAIHAGAHVYLQKPVSVDVLEGEAILAAARKHNRVVQVGTQRRSTPHLVHAKKNIVDAGLLGKVSHVEMCCYYHMRQNGNPPQSPVPSYFDYETWTGPAPLRPFDKLPHGGWWRSFMEYGNGIMGDMGIHMFDTVRWMLGLGWPKRIQSNGGIYVDKGGKSNTSDTQWASFEYDDLTCIWQHRTWGRPSDPEYPWAFFIYGDKGTLKADVYKYDFIPEGKAAPIHQDVVYEKKKYPEEAAEPRIERHAAPATRLHILNFLSCIEGGQRPVADIEEGNISSACCILANLSMQTGRPLIYDPERKLVVNDAEASRLLQRPYRGPWTHPYPTKR